MPKIHPFAMSLLSQFMDWDEDQQVWNIHVPLPQRAQIDWFEHVDCDALLDVHNVLMENGVNYSTIELDGYNAAITGLSMVEVGTH